jgi:hypothetical protein
MRSFRRLALMLALGLPALPVIQAQSSSSTPPAPAQDQDQAGPQQAPGLNNQEQSVQARIRARREQRRAAAIHDAYSQLYEAYVGGGYLRFQPGQYKQRLTFYAWDIGLTRYFNERLGVTAAGRGYYGTAYVGLNPYGLTRPAISEYNAMIGPTYRFYLQPRYSVSGRVLGGYARSNFSADTNGIGGKTLGLWPDGGTFAVSGAVIGEVNVTPGFALRLAPEYFITGFGSTMQYSRGFTAGMVYRFGKR